MTRNKFAIFFTLLFSMCMALYSAWSDLKEDQRVLDNVNHVESRLNDIIEINALMTQIQKERGLTAINDADPNAVVKAALTTERQETTALLRVSDKTSLVDRVRSARADTLQLVEHSDSLPDDVFNRYSTIIAELLRASESLIFETGDPELKNLLIIYHLLANAQESTGRLRAKIGTALASSKLTAENLRDIIALDAIYHNLISKSATHLPPRFQSLVTDVQMKPCVRETFTVVEATANRMLPTQTLSALAWFELSTCAIDDLNQLGQTHLQTLQSQIVSAKSSAENTRLRHLFFWGGGLATLLFMLSIILKRSKALALKHKLLENYQEAIDYSTIVSKTDKRGIITYVNQDFCDISGYAPEELLHRSHNIVRHPDVPKAFFKSLWDDLHKGKKWRGVIKNLKKDGSTYWVDASISPLYDEKGALIEYIAIRRDVTDLFLLNQEIKETQRELIYRMGEAVESRSKESGHHIQRVAHYSRLLAEIAGLSSEECEIILASSTMHDIGKISISDEILLKAEALTPAEWSVMKTHAEIGYRILEGSEHPLLKIAATVAYEHHEHFDGNGYPRGLKGEAISIYGRIVAIADVFDALVTERTYKEAWPLEAIVAYFKEQSGKQFDPNLIDHFLNHLDRFLEIQNNFKDQDIKNV